MSDNSWFEMGSLPPQGHIVEYSPIHYGTLGVELGKWYQGKIIAYHGGYVWTSDNGIRMLDNTKFRPARSDRDKVIDSAIKVINAPSQLGILYDAGYLKLPD